MHMKHARARAHAHGGTCTCTWQAARGSARAAPSAEEMLAFVAACAAENGDNWSSMRQDVVNRRRTEIEQLNGWVVARSVDLGLAAVHNEWLTNSVRCL